MSDVALTITPLQLSSLPSDESILAAAETLLESTSSWKQGKTYHKIVKTYSRPKLPEDGAPWHCRVSIHTPEEATFDQLWAKLGTDKAINEKEFIPDIKKAVRIKEISPTQSIWTMYYKFTPPVSPRVFTVLQVTHLQEETPRTGIIVSIPVDLTGDESAQLEEKGVKGRYVSIERVKELEDGNVEWTMATSSTPGGNIPTIFVEASMASKIAEDVPHFMKWLHSLPQ